MNAIGHRLSLVRNSESSTHLCQAPWWSRSPKIGCALQTLWMWVQRHKLASDVRDGVTN